MIEHAYHVSLGHAILLHTDGESDTDSDPDGDHGSKNEDGENEDDALHLKCYLLLLDRVILLKP